MLPEIEPWKTAYDEDSSVIYLLDDELKIARCNRAWDRFAIANQGHQAVSSRVIGRPVFDFVPAVLREFYVTAYNTVRHFRRDWWHTFECSSASVTRFFQMRILPCDDDGLLTINTLISEHPVGLLAEARIEKYTTSDGIVVMCSHCRRVQSIDDRETWDWVPELLMTSEVLMRFGLCGFCTAYHYHLR